MSSIALPAQRSRGTIADHYRQLFGWQVELAGGRTFLVMGAGMVGVAVSTVVARLTLDRLGRQGNGGPVLGAHTKPDSWLFLADPNGVVLARSDLPVYVTLHGCPSPIELPSSAEHSPWWVIAPNSRRRWLPTVAAVLSAATFDETRLHRPADWGHSRTTPAWAGTFGQVPAR